METTKSDTVLLDEARSGDMNAFRAIVERHEGKVAGVVKGMLGDIPEASDVGQEVFIRLFESLENFKGESALSTYVVRIAINLSLNEIKRRKRKITMFESLDQAADRGAEESADLKEMLEHEIRKLEPDFRVVVTLRMVEGYSVEETAALLGIPVGTVMSRLYRAQKKLKQDCRNRTL
jgi:RNA polymerase sigma-70 factor (ECF subfamily)